MSRSSARLVPVLLTASLLLAACGGGESAAPGGGGGGEGGSPVDLSGVAVNVGSKEFTEQLVLGPRLGGRLGHHLLRQDVQRLVRHDQGVQLAAAHAAQQRAGERAVRARPARLALEGRLKLCVELRRVSARL